MKKVLEKYDNAELIDNILLFFECEFIKKLSVPTKKEYTEIRSEIVKKLTDIVEIMIKMNMNCINSLTENQIIKFLNLCVKLVDNLIKHYTLTQKLNKFNDIFFIQNFLEIWTYQHIVLILVS